MPRLTNDQHYERHLILKRAWTEMTQLYSALLPKDQAAIHAYYQPSKDLTPRPCLGTDVRSPRNSQVCLSLLAGRTS
jgi:hypothetical protein